MAKKSSKKTAKPVRPQLGEGVEILNAGSVLEDPITRTLETNYMPYAMSVIVSRALPEIDGFKPAHRKLLYTMYEMGLIKGARTKSANIVGSTMHLNPHGDAAIYDTMVRMGRGNESLLVPFVDSKGNFGKAYSRDMSCAAARYTEAKLESVCEELFRDIDKETVDFVPNYDGGTTPGALPTANGESNVENLKKVVNEYHGGVGPYMVAEFYPGWLMHWAEPFPDISDSGIARQTETYLQNDVSFNFYMVHGGTNFGFTSGANYDKKHDIQPDLTSYDYDAPISEAGWVTPKFDSIRNVIRKYVTYDVPEAPAPIPLIEVPSISLTKVADVLALAKEGEPVASTTPLTFEQLNQGYGYVLYSTHFNQPLKGRLEIPGLRDYATIYVDGERVGELNRCFNQYAMEIDIPFNATLDILVENMGRINYGVQRYQNTRNT